MPNPNGPGPIQTKALWTWSHPSSGFPVPVSFPYGLTKSGVTAQDVRDFIGVPAVFFGPNGSQTPMTDSSITKIIRNAEDQIETDTGLCLCPTQIAAAPANKPLQAQSLNIIPQDGSLIQRIGYDYDRYDAPYDYRFDAGQENGWMYQRIRYRPVRGPNPDDYSGLQLYSFVYPLLNDFFNVDPSWFEIDQDFGLLRLVPNTSVQMLPLFQLLFQFGSSMNGPANSVPGGIYLQYTAGLTPIDYMGDYSFVTQLVLATVAIRILPILQGSVNFGVNDMTTVVDGLQTRVSYNRAGAYAGLIDTFLAMQTDLMKTTKDKIGGPIFTFL